MTNRPITKLIARRAGGGNKLTRSVVAASAVVALSVVAFAQEASWDKRFDFSADVVAATRLTGTDDILAAGEFGMLALIDFKGESSTAKMIESDHYEDYLAVVPLDDGSALLAGAEGNVLRYSEGKVEVVQKLGEDSVLDISVQRDAAGQIEAVWAAGGRGILAVSRDGGKTFEDAAPARVGQPTLALPSPDAITWYSGVGNVYEDSVVVTGNVGGRPAEAGKDYLFTSEDGILEVMNAFDPEPAPSLAFDFQPGPPFQAGDFTLSSLVFQGELITAVGEFGFILQSADGGATWIRRAGELHSRDPGTPYWISARARGDTILLVGAAGAVTISSDRGETWAVAAPPSAGGVFGGHLSDDRPPLVVGAVGLLGEQSGDSWKLVDRSALSLYSWLKTVLVLEDNTLLALGGRGSCVFRKGSNWERCQIRLTTDDNA